MINYYKDLQILLSFKIKINKAAYGKGNNVIKLDLGAPIHGAGVLVEARPSLNQPFIIPSTLCINSLAASFVVLNL